MEKIDVKNEGDTSLSINMMKQEPNTNIDEDGVIYALEDVSEICVFDCDKLSFF